MMFRVLRLLFLFLLCFVISDVSAQEITKKRGKVKFRYADGKISSRGKVKNYKRTGTWKYYDTNGNVVTRANFVNDTIHGAYTEYYPNGEIFVAGTYCMNQKCGNWKTYGEKGRLISDENFRNALAEGVQKFWYPNGNLRDSLIMNNGVLLYRQAWYTDGHVKAIEPYKNGLPHGQWITYADPASNSDTTPASVVEYKDGLKHGWYLTYRANRLSEKYFYQEGKSQGEQLRWDNDGTLAMREYYTAGMRDSGTYYIRGVIARSTYFRNERKHGPEVDYDRDGDTLKLTWWNNGATDSSFTYHKNGRRSSSLQYEHTKGTAHYTEWDTSGRKLQEGMYLDDRRHGEWYTFYPDGKKRSVTNYSEGKMMGLFTKWYPNGKKMIEMNFLPAGVNTQPDAWNEKGKPLKMGTREYNEIVEGNRPGEIFSDASQYNRPIIDRRVEELKINDESVLEFYPDPGYGNSDYLLEEDTIVRTVCQVVPVFPGGDQARLQFIRDHLSETAKKQAGSEGSVTIAYLVEADGSVTAARIVDDNTGSGELSSDVVTAVMHFPRHKPASENGTPIRCEVILTVHFPMR